MILYPGRQARLVEQLRAAAPDRVGIFTRWSYDHAHPRPWVAPIYLHAKTAVVDDTWATIGSANLDGLSLDHNLLLSPLAFGETTAAELNVTILEGTPGASGMPPAERHPPTAVVASTWASWAPTACPTRRTAGWPAPRSWLPLWKQSAKDSLTHLKNGTAAPLPGFVLEYPEDAGSLVTGAQAPRRARCPARPQRAEGPPHRRSPGRSTSTAGAGSSTTARTSSAPRGRIDP